MPPPPTHCSSACRWPKFPDFRHNYFVVIKHCDYCCCVITRPPPTITHTHIDSSATFYAIRARGRTDFKVTTTGMTGIDDDDALWKKKKKRFFFSFATHAHLIAVVVVICILFFVSLRDERGGIKTRYYRHAF